MAYPKVKNENYRNLGGMNTKLSQYETGSEQFLNIINMDFQTPASLTKRWGSSMYVGQTFPAAVTSLYEYVRTNGFSQVIIGMTGGVFAGATTGNSQGLSFGANGATVAVNGGSNQFIIGAQVRLPNGAGTGTPFAYNNMNNYSGDYFINPLSLGNGYYDFIVNNDVLYMGNGTNFFKYDGTTVLRDGLPPTILVNDAAGREVPGTTAQFGTSYGFLSIPFGNTGYIFYAQLQNASGLMGPINPIFYLGAGGSGIISMASAERVTAFGGTTSFALTVQTWIPQTYGGSLAINVYAYAGADVLTTQNLNVDFIFSRPLTFAYRTPVSPSASAIQLENIVLGVPNNFLFVGDVSTSDFNAPLGFTFFQFYSGITVGVPGMSLFYNIGSTGYPTYLETHLNRSFYAGFGGALTSAVRYSEILNPEQVLPESQFTFATADGDLVTGIRSYSQKLYVFKQNSFAVLTGDNPDNFTLQEVSFEYGCLSNRAIVVFNDIMLFLDRKGIVRFDGANFSLISTTIESVFDSMNINAAIGRATMIHDKRRTQIIIGIPVNNSEVNNLTIIYDYDLNAWALQDGYSPAVFSVVRGRLSDQTAMYGNYSGQVNNFGPSFFADNGNGFTCLFQSRFLHDMGETTQKMWRRLWLNMDPVGQTSVLNIQFFKDFSATATLNRIMYQSPFQSRIDYGISAKALSFQMTQFNATLPCRVHGFGIASRYLRDV